MNRIRTRGMVGANYTITGTAPAELPPGEREALIAVQPLPDRRRARQPFDIDALPSINLGPWPEGLTLGREDLYGDDGR